MTTLSADTPRTHELGGVSMHPIVANDIVYEGAAVGDNASGYARPLVAGDKFLGFAKNKCDNTVSGPAAAAGAAGDLNVMVQTKGEILLTISGAALTDHGKAVYASDDDTFTFTAAGNTFIGFVKRYDSATGKCVVAYDASDSGRAQAPLTASFTINAQSGAARTVNIQVKYATGQDVAEVRSLFFYVSSDAGGGSMAPPAGGTDVTLAGSTDGMVIETLNNAAGFIVTESDGDCDMVLTQVTTGVDTVYLNLVMPDGRVVTSSAIAFSGATSA